MKKIFSCLLLLACAAGAGAQSFNKPKMDSLFDVLAKNDRAMGSFVLARNGKVLYEKAIGAAEIRTGGKVAANTHTKYRIGSVTKMFTAAMIFQLVEANKISLSTPLSNYYPMVPNAKDITIGQLLWHRSGIHNFTDDDTYAKWEEQPRSKLQLLAVFAAARPDFPPDSTARYSNANYVLLGMILEDIYKKPYATILKEQITGKAKLKDTYYGGRPDVKKNEAASYRYEDQWVPAKITDMSIPGGAGAIVSTPSDLSRFVTLLFQGKIVSPASVTQMQKIRDNYGMGLFTFLFGSHRFYGHTGSIDAFVSVAGYNMADSLVFAYCSNGTRYSRNEIAVGVLSIYYGEPYTIPDFRTIAVAAADLDQYTGLYTTDRLPISMTITRDGNVLKAQATGQGAFPLEAKEKDKFVYDPAGAVLLFDPRKNTLTLEQAGGRFIFTRAADK